MAQTTVSNSSGLNPILVLEKVIAQYAERENWYSKFIGESPVSIIQKMTQLEKTSGDTIKVTLFSKLASEGTDGDNVLENNEDALVPLQDTLLIDQKRNAVRIAGKMTDQRSAVNLHTQASYALGVWARDWMSELITIHLAGLRGTRSLTVIPTSFTGFGGNTLQAPDAVHTLWAGTAATEAGLTSADKMTTAVLDKANLRIDLLINAGVPMKFPMVNGEEQRSLKISPEQWYDLQQDADWQTAQENAGPRDSKNPLFSGLKGKWKGLNVFVDPAAVLSTSSGSVPFARAQILGCQAAVLAFGGVDEATDGGAGKWAAKKEEFDYGNQTGFAIATILGVKKLRLNSADHAVFSINTAYTA